MDKGNLEFLSKTVEQSSSAKHAILNNDASTIVESFSGPKIVSTKKKKKVKIFSSGGKVIVKTVSKINNNKPSSKRKIDGSSEKEEESVVKKTDYKKGDVNRFGDYKGVTAPKDKNITYKKDMSSSNNNGFMAAIVEQTGGGKSAIMTNDASTIVEKYQTPMMKPEEEMDDDEDVDMEEEMSDFASVDSVELPTVWLNTKQLPGAQGLVVGDKVYLMVEAEVYNHLVSENSEGITRDEYTFKLKKGCVKKDD